MQGACFLAEANKSLTLDGYLSQVTGLLDILMFPADTSIVLWSRKKPANAGNVSASGIFYRVQGGHVGQVVIPVGAVSFDVSTSQYSYS